MSPCHSRCTPSCWARSTMTATLRSFRSGLLPAAAHATSQLPRFLCASCLMRVDAHRACPWYSCIVCMQRPRTLLMVASTHPGWRRQCDRWRASRVLERRSFEAEANRARITQQMPFKPFKRPLSPSADSPLSLRKQVVASSGAHPARYTRAPLAAANGKVVMCER